jgi:hypothetical protein
MVAEKRNCSKKKKKEKNGGGVNSNKLYRLMCQKK